MEFERTYRLDTEDCNVKIFFHDDVLDKIIVEKGNKLLVHKYQDDALLECIINGHDHALQHNKLIGNVGGTEYHEGMIAITDKGAVHLHEVQAETGNQQYGGVKIHYMGRYFMMMNKFITNSDTLETPGDLKLYRVVQGAYAIDVQPKYTDSNDMFFLLGFAKGSAFPYYQIENLPGIGLKEVILAFSDLYREQIYLTYMHKLFGSNSKNCFFEIEQDELSCSRETTVVAKLNSCYMKMESDGDSYHCSITDSDDEIHDFNLDNDNLRKTFHYEVVFRVPKLF